MYFTAQNFDHDGHSSAFSLDAGNRCQLQMSFCLDEVHTVGVFIETYIHFFKKSYSQLKAPHFLAMVYKNEQQHIAYSCRGSAMLEKRL